MYKMKIEGTKWNTFIINGFVRCILVGSLYSLYELWKFLRIHLKNKIEILNEITQRQCNYFCSFFFFVNAFKTVYRVQSAEWIGLVILWSIWIQSVIILLLYRFVRFGFECVCFLLLIIIEKSAIAVSLLVAFGAIDHV